MHHALTMLVMSVIFSLLFYFSRRSSTVVDYQGQIVLQYAKALTYILVFMISILPLGLFFFVGLKFGLKESEYWLFYSCMFGFGIGGIYLYLRFTKEKIIANSDHVQAVYPFSTPRLLRWSDITRVKYATNGKYLILESHEGIKIRVNIMLTGFQQFCSFAASRVPYAYRGDEIEKAARAPFFP